MSSESVSVVRTKTGGCGFFTHQTTGMHNSPKGYWTLNLALHCASYVPLVFVTVKEIIFCFLAQSSLCRNLGLMKTGWKCLCKKPHTCDVKRDQDFKLNIT
jgi:hypothetical protein